MIAQIPTNTFGEAQKRINNWKSKNTGLRFRPKQALDLSGIGLTDGDLKQLMPELIKLTGLKVLVLHKNNLTVIPDGIQKLYKLKVLDISLNSIAELSNDISNLKSVKTLNLIRNPLSDTSLLTLYNLTRNQNKITVFTESESIDKLRSLFPGQPENEIRQMDVRIGSLARRASRFTDGNELSPAILSGDRIIDSFLSDVAGFYGSEAIIQHYNIATRHLLNQALSADITESESALTQIASSLGNCPTPVIDLLEKTGIQLALASNKKPGNSLIKLLHRQAFEELIKKERIIPASSKESIEIMQGLTNTLFMYGAEENSLNFIKIVGERPRIASKTGNVIFAFDEISRGMARHFAKLCCKTDHNNKLITDRRGRFHLDADKYYKITERYVEKQGILNAKARARKKHIAKLQQLIRKPENRDLSLDLELVDFQKIEDELRLKMRDLPIEQIKAVIEESLTSYKTKMEEVREDVESAQISGITENRIDNPVLLGNDTTQNEGRTSFFRRMMTTSSNTRNRTNNDGNRPHNRPSITNTSQRTRKRITI